MTDDNNNNADHESWNVHLSVAHADTVFHGCGLKVLAHCQLCPYLWGTVWITRPTRLVTRPEHGTLTHTHVKHCEAMRRQPTAGCSPDEITSKISLKISQNHWRQLWTSGSLWPIETRKWKKRIPCFFRQVARSWRCREVIPPGGNVKFQTRTISSSKITLEPTKPSISQSCPGAHGLGSPKSSLGMAVPVRSSRRRRRKLHVENATLIPAPIFSEPQGHQLEPWWFSKG